MIERKEYIRIKEILIIGIIIILTVLMFSVKTDSTIVNVENIGLPEKAIEELRKILGR